MLPVDNQLYDSLLPHLFKLERVDDGVRAHFFFMKTTMLVAKDLSEIFNDVKHISGGTAYGISGTFKNQEAGEYFWGNWECNYRFDNRTTTHD
jgi:hypothetical protein